MREMVGSPLWTGLDERREVLASAILPVIQAWDDGAAYPGVGELVGGHDLAAAIATVLHMKGLA